MKKRANALGGFQLDVTDDTHGAVAANSYDINQQGTELKLRAFLFRDGALYRDGATITSISIDDVDLTTKRCVGRGASGTVYYVLNRKTREPLALKEIAINSKARRDEVSAELAVLAEDINHPHITRHFGAFWMPEIHSIALVMEWMAYSLEDIVRIFGQMDEHVVQLVTVQLVAGLCFLHNEKRVIHRDIKPSNILVNAVGEVKYGDFGISKVVQTIQPSSTFVGTQLFMAPERLEEGQYSFVSDVWSLGLTLVCCATGRRPWLDDGEEEGSTSLFQMIQRMATGSVPQLPNTYSPDARDFVSRCLERDPALRATATELSTHPFVRNIDIETSKQELAGMLSMAAQLARRASSVDDPV